MRLTLATLPLVVVALAACDGGGDPVQQALRETAEANQSATVKEGTVSGPVAHDEDNAAPNAGDQAYVAGMIAHHQGAVEMAQAALRDSRDPEIRRMAQAVVDTQTQEIAEMRAWRPQATAAD